ncbi:MAG: hypothetical protein IH597_06315 [Bacteroidales bacterium]|nr:hypothetical protein [Bacteroidales bacterium]
MKKIILISCVSKKLEHKAKAKDLYISPLFVKNLQYAETLNPDQIYILSAKYGLLHLNDEIESYDVTLNNMSTLQIREWAEGVLNQLRLVTDLEYDEFIFLAGNNYRKYLLPHLKHYNLPMEGLSIGKQLQWLTKNIRHE